MSAPALVLGSASPRRRELLASLGVTPDRLASPDIDETPRAGELPRDYCIRVTREKAEAVDIGPGEILLTADTTVALGRRILGKPADAGEAAAFLVALGGRRHKVITAVALKDSQGVRVKDVVTSVKMKRLSDTELNGYLATGDWQGKAGAYGIQGPAGAFIPWIQGSYTAVMGLPVSETAALLASAGYPLFREAA